MFQKSDIKEIFQIVFLSLVFAAMVATLILKGPKVVITLAGIAIFPPLLSLALASAAKIMAEAAVPATLTTSQAVLALPEWLLWKNSKEVFFQGLLNRVLHF